MKGFTGDLDRGNTKLEFVGGYEMVPLGMEMMVITNVVPANKLNIGLGCTFE